MFQALALHQISASPLLNLSRTQLLAYASPTSTCHRLILHRNRAFPLRRLLAPRYSKEANDFRTKADNRSGGEDTEEEIDEEELDALFDELGEVVLADTNPRSPSTEVDDDSQSLAFAVALAGAANDGKAAEIMVLHVKPLVYWTRFFVIATAFSRPQLDAIGKRMRDVAEERFKTAPRGDTKPNSWTLLDFGDVVVHIFLPKERAYYNLEEFYGNAISIDLPFNSHAAPRLG